VKEYSIDVLEVLGRALKDEHPVVYLTTVRSCMFTIALLEIIVKEPDLPEEYRAHARLLVADLTGGVLELHPELQEYVIGGWTLTADGKGLD